jgi:hypothetical protein
MASRINTSWSRGPDAEVDGGNGSARIGTRDGEPGPKAVAKWIRSSRRGAATADKVETTEHLEARYRVQAATRDMSGRSRLRDPAAARNKVQMATCDEVTGW